MGKEQPIDNKSTLTKEASSSEIANWSIHTKVAWQGKAESKSPMLFPWFTRPLRAFDISAPEPY